VACYHMATSVGPTGGEIAVLTLAEEWLGPRWLSVVMAAYTVSKRIDGTAFAGSWVLAELQRSDDLEHRPGLQVLARFGVIAKEGKSTLGAIGPTSSCPIPMASIGRYSASGTDEGWGTKAAVVAGAVALARAAGTVAGLVYRASEGTSAIDLASMVGQMAWATASTTRTPDRRRQTTNLPRAYIPSDTSVQRQKPQPPNRRRPSRLPRPVAAGPPSPSHTVALPGFRREATYQGRVGHPGYQPTRLAGLVRVATLRGLDPSLG
jgi:hypothetical protein